MRRSDNEPHKFISVQVEIRMWRKRESVGGSSLCPVAVPAVLVSEGASSPVLVIEDNDGETFLYPPEEAKAEGFGSILVPFEPSPEQLRTLTAAARRGYPVEPRIVGEPLISIEDM